MIDYWRELLYPLGFLSAMAFGARVLLQWVCSEVKGRSLIMPAFWKLSLCGNLLLFTHAFIQVQFHVCLIQACNAVISWRNLNLMQPVDRQATTRRTVWIMAVAAGAVGLVFALQGYFFQSGASQWFRIPAVPWQINGEKQASLAWHMLGFFGLVLFNSRFWLQWWCIEKYRESYLGSSFWLCSLVGEGLCLAYFFRIEDPVNFIGPALGLIPYLRNLMLISKNRQRQSQSIKQ